MRELSLHILDIVQNSIAAGANRVEILAAADTTKDTLHLSVRDNGRGMSPEMAAKVRDPFFTTRTVRKVGLGIPMLAVAAEMAGGNLAVKSEVGKGTEIDATFQLSHIDRAPYGDIVSTLITLIVANPEMDFLYIHEFNDKTFRLDTAEVKHELDPAPIGSVTVISWLKQYIKEGIETTGAIP